MQEKTENLDDVKISAVLLAGKDEINLWKANLVRYLSYSFTGRDYYFDKYKPVLNAHPNGQYYLPLILPSLVALSKAEHVNDIVVVGRKQELEEKLENVLDYFDKLKIIEQVGDIGENALAGSEKTELSGHKIIIEADTPMITGKEIDSLIKQCLKYDNGWYFPNESYLAMVSEETVRKMPMSRSSKSFMKLIPDKQFCEKERNKQFRYENGRYGFKESNWALSSGNVDPQGIADIHSIRLLLLPWTWLKFGKMAKQKGVEKEMKALLKDYFKGTATTSHVHEFLSEFSGIDLNLVETEFPSFSWDIDEREDLRKLLNYAPYIHKVGNNFSRYAVPK